MDIGFELNEKDKLKKDRLVKQIESLLKKTFNRIKSNERDSYRIIRSALLQVYLSQLEGERIYLEPSNSRFLYEELDLHAGVLLAFRDYLIPEKPKY